MNKVVLFNPRSANAKHRIPNSILQVAASIHGKHEYVIVDGNLEKDPWTTIQNYLKTGGYGFFGCTVMPGPQLRQAIPYSKKMRELYPDVKIIWGGYFPANQYSAVINSGYVDFIINGPGDVTFPELLNALNHNSNYSTIQNLIFKKGKLLDHLRQNCVIRTVAKITVDYLNNFTFRQYMGKTFMETTRPTIEYGAIQVPFAPVQIYMPDGRGSLQIYFEESSM